MKYNTGDKVISEEDLDFLFNPFWKEKYRKSLIRTVTEANENEFTIYNDKGRYNSTLENGHSCGMNSYLIFFQSSGKQNNYPCPIKLLHLKEDRSYIIEKINEIGEKYFNEENKHIEEQIKYYVNLKEKSREVYEKDLKTNLELIEK
jgi:hypothetical protein